MDYRYNILPKISFYLKSSFLKFILCPPYYRYLLFYMQPGFVVWEGKYLMFGVRLCVCWRLAFFSSAEVCPMGLIPALSPNNAPSHYLKFGSAMRKMRWYWNLISVVVSVLSYLLYPNVGGNLFLLLNNFFFDILNVCSFAVEHFAWSDHNCSKKF